MLRERSGRRQRIRSTRTDRQHSIVRRDHITIARQQKRTLIIGDNEQGLEMTQHFVSARFLAKFDRRPLEVSVILFQLAFKSRQQRKGVGGGSSEARQYTIVVEPANLLSVCFHDSFAQCDLTVTSKCDAIRFADEQHGRAANAWSFFRHFW